MASPFIRHRFWSLSVPVSLLSRAKLLKVEITLSSFGSAMVGLLFNRNSVPTAGSTPCFIFVADSLCYKIKFSCSWDRNAWRSLKPDVCVEGYSLQNFFMFFGFVVLSFSIFLPWLYEPFSGLSLLSLSLLFVKFLPVFSLFFPFTLCIFWWLT